MDKNEFQVGVNLAVFEKEEKERAKFCVKMPRVRQWL